MGCGGCARRRERMSKQFRQIPTAPPQPKLFCPACQKLETESEYNKCPFRLQLERQKARRAQLEKRIEESSVQNQIINRRGRQIHQQFSSTRPIPTRKKW